MKFCISCDVELNKTNYTWYRAKNYIHKCTSCCNDEKKEQARKRMQDPEYRKSQAERSNKHNSSLKFSDPVLYTCRQMCASSKKRADALGLSRDITPEYLLSIAGDVCPILGKELKYGGGDRSNNSASIDRIDPRNGYVIGNVHIVCLLANLMKSSATIDEIIMFSKWADRTYLKAK